MTNEDLQTPSQSTHTDKHAGYKSLAANLERFHELGQLPKNVTLQRLDDGQGLESTMIAHKAKWHKQCTFQFNNTMLKSAEKRQTL